MANKYAVETAFNIIDNATAPLAKIGVKGNAVGKQLKKDFMKAQDQLAGIGKAAKKVGIAIVAAGAAAAGAFAAKGLKDAIEFNTELTKVSTVADLSKISLEELSKQIMDISNSTGVSASELAKFQYQVINSGIATADSAEYVAAAVRTSKAAFTDTGVVVEGLTKVMNAYQLEASEAEKVAGQMYLATTIGNSSFEELNSSLGRVLPTAARMNIQTDELFASIAALTANAVETPKAVKGIQNILEKVQNPTAAVSRAAAQLGIDFSAAALESKGLAGFLQEVQEKTGGCENTIMTLFGSVEALNAVNIITTRGIDTFNEALGEMQNAASVVDTAFNKVMESPAERWSRVMNRIKNAGINLGTALLPMVEKVMGEVEKFAVKLGEIDFEPIANKAASVFNQLINFAKFIGSLIALIWKLRVPILAVVGAVALYKGGMLAAAAAVNIFTAAKGVFKGIMLAVTLITGNQTRAMALYKAGTMGASVQTMLFAARQKAAAGASALLSGALFKQAGAFLALKAQLVAAKIATVAMTIAQKAATVIKAIATAAQWALNIAMTASPIGIIIMAVVALIAGIVALVKNFDKVKEAFAKIWEGIKAIFGKIGEFFKGVWGGIKEGASKAWNGIKNGAGKAWEGIKGAASKAGGFLKNNWKSIAVGIVNPMAGGLHALYKNHEGFRNLVDGVWGKIKDTAGKAWNGIKNVASKAWNGIKDGAGKLKENAVNNFNRIKDGAGAAFNKAKEFGSNAWEKIKETGFNAWGQLETRFPGLANVISTVFNKIKDIISGIIDKIKDIFNGFKNFFVGLWESLKEGPAAVLDYIKNAFIGLFEGIKQKFFGFIDVIRNGWESVKGFFGGVKDKVGGIFNRNTAAPAQVASVVPPGINQTTTTTAGVPSTPNINRNNQTITAATAPASRPMTTAEQYSYSQTTHRENVDIAVRAEQGTSARVVQPPRSPNVTVAASGGNG
jgi:TP901 family phage tail tape measure protein